MTVIKVCGITNVEDALACADLGADILGLIFAESPRQVTVDIAKDIVAALASQVKTAGVFVEESDSIIDIIGQCGLDFAQLHGNQSEVAAGRIGTERVIRVVRVKDTASIERLSEFKSAAFFLLDTYRKGHAGGTGEVFDWDLAIAAKSLGKPIILSGGLHPDNIFEAIRRVRPFAVDVSSGVELRPGKKDLIKVKEFIDHVREADNAS